jgi:hypothetical protein
MIPLALPKGKLKFTLTWNLRSTYPFTSIPWSGGIPASFPFLGFSLRITLA